MENVQYTYTIRYYIATIMNESKLQETTWMNCKSLWLSKKFKYYMLPLVKFYNSSNGILL